MDIDIKNMENEKQYFINKNNTIVASNRILYTASPFARSSLLHLKEVGELKALKLHKSERSNLNSFLFFMVISGTGKLFYNKSSYGLHPGDCVFIDCRKKYSHTAGMRTQPQDFCRNNLFGPEGNNIQYNDLWTLRWVHFFGPTAALIYEKYCERGGQPVFTPDNSSAGKINAVWSSLMAVAGSDDYMRDMLLNQHLSKLLTLIMAESWHFDEAGEAHSGMNKRQSVLEVKNYIEGHYNGKISLEELSSRFFVDKYYMSKSFKEQFGVNISSYIMNLRITKAKQMLRFSNKSIEEIGYAVGLNSPAYFGRVFKKIEGVSPGIYRKQWQAILLPK